MSKRASIPINIVATILSVWHPHYALGANSDLTCVLSCDRETYEVGQQPVFTVRITNNSSKEVLFVGSLDGSTTDRRFPQCRFEIIDSTGKPVKTGLGICGNMNVLRTEDFVAIVPGGSFNPFGKGFFSPYQFHHFPVEQPGVYTVRFSYSTSSDKVADYFGDERMAGLRAAKPEIQRLFNRIAHVELKSKELKLTFTSRSK